MKHIILTVSCIFIITTATAQKGQMQDASSKHELSVYSMGGYSPMSYTLVNNGSTSSAIGGGAGVGYTFNISPSLGIVTGVEMATYSTEAKFDNVSDKYDGGTGNNRFELSYYLKNYKETQNVKLFSVPVMAQYNIPLGNSTVRFYASGGFKLGFPVSATADITPGTATTESYFLYEKVAYKELSQHGLVKDKALPEVGKDIDLGFSVALALEAGVRFLLTEKIDLYTGLYFDNSLNNVQKTNDRHLLEYEYSPKVNESRLNFNSVLNTGFTDKVNLMSIGLKLRIGFKL
jgi:hypothetical protein